MLTPRVLGVALTLCFFGVLFLGSASGSSASAAFLFLGVEGLLPPPPLAALAALAPPVPGAHQQQMGHRRGVCAFATQFSRPK